MRLTKALGAAGFALLACKAAAADEVPRWQQPLAGTPAFLGDDGGADFATVCRSADSYRAWSLSYQPAPADCRRFRRGLKLVIKAVVYDPAKDKDDTIGDGWPLAKINIPSAGFTGYLQLFNLKPHIPPGTVVHLVKVPGTGTLRLASSAKLQLAPSGMPLDAGLDLGERATARIMRYDPSADFSHDLYVTITDGRYAGRSGWVSSSDIGRGSPQPFFTGSLIEANQPLSPSQQPVPQNATRETKNVPAGDAMPAHAPPDTPPAGASTEARVPLDLRLAKKLPLPEPLAAVQKAIGAPGGGWIPKGVGARRSGEVWYRWYHRCGNNMSFGDAVVRDGQVVGLWFEGCAGETVIRRANGDFHVVDENGKITFLSQAQKREQGREQA